MKNKGYTLIELLGVMILLALLMGIVFPTIINSIKNSSKETDELTLSLVDNAAGLYIKDNYEKFSSIYGNTYCISINTLIENNYLKGKLKYEGEALNDSKSVKVTYTDKYNYEVVDKNSCNGFVVDLMSNLIPVIYNGSNWVVANTNKEWYNYEKQAWANAVILDSSVSKKVGDVVTVDGDNPDALAMFVWIPRYEYKIEGTYGKGGTSAELPGEIEINFISKNETEASEGYKVHPAFTFGTEKLSGIWVGKFEVSHTTLSSSTTNNNLGCSTETCTIADGLRILPNVTSLRYNNNSNFFYAIRSMERSGNAFGIDSSITDSHMMKNSEWGAVAYLSQSKYGKYGNSNYTGTNKEIYQNKSSSFITTGSSNGTPSTPTTSTQCTYNDTTNNCGIGASTTGNIYGIYDMSGGAYERVMGVFANSNGDLWSGHSSSYNSGFDGKVGESGTDYDGVPFPTPEYYDLYKASSGTTISSETACSVGICYGHALSETVNWYGDTARFVSTSSPWFIRGGGSSDGLGSGVFSSYYNNGDPYSDSSTRVVLVPTT